MAKFKIDLNIYASDVVPFAIYRQDGGLFRGWRHMASFPTKDEAREFYARIKDLPEYLN